MTTLKYFTMAAVEELRGNVAKRLDWYYEPSTDMPPQWSQWLKSPDPVREAEIQIEPLSKPLESNDQRLDKLDAKFAVAVYRSLQTLTRHQASEERLWTYLCHTEYARYTAARWLDTRPKDDDAAAVRKVRNHFFARGNRALIRDNAVSRLWWLGYIAHEINPDDPLMFLKVILHRQDIRSALIERPSVSMNHNSLRSIYAIMKEHWDAEGDNAALFQRDAFRRWMVNLNRRGGVILLDALDKKTLDSVLRSEAEEAIRRKPAQT